MAGNPVIQEMGIDQSQGSMEGKEVHFGVPQSALFTTVTTSFTTGTVNNMHDTLTPLGGLVPLLHMMLNCVFGGKGCWPYEYGHVCHSGSIHLWWPDGRTNTGIPE